MPKFRRRPVGVWLRTNLRPYGCDQYSFCLISVNIYILSLAGFVVDTVWFTLRLQRQRGVIHEAAVTSGVEANGFETLEA